MAKAHDVHVRIEPYYDDGGGHLVGVHCEWRGDGGCVTADFDSIEEWLGSLEVCGHAGADCAAGLRALRELGDLDPNLAPHLERARELLIRSTCAALSTEMLIPT